MKNKSEKSCESCKFYSQHYVLQGLAYRPICCGLCLNDNNLNRQKKKIKTYDVCEYWESIEIKKEERKKAIKETLDFIAKKLDEIAMILKNDTKI